MKKPLLIIVALCGALALTGCHHRATSQLLTDDTQREQVPMQQSYRGILPCADCEGIETDLFLDRQGSWVMNLHYLGRGVSFATYGTWQRTADRLVLTEGRDEKIYFIAKKDGSLEKLDAEGQPIQSTLNFTLRPTTLALPTTPMRMIGEYTYLADAAVFTDCKTGQKIPVELNAALQKSYLSVTGNGGKPVLLTFDAHFVQQPNPDSGETQNVLVSNGKSKFSPNGQCPQ